MKIEVIGSGCKKCEALFKLTGEVVNKLNIDNCDLSYSTDVSKIIGMGLVSNPVLAIDDQPILVGVLPDSKKLEEIILRNI